MLDSGSTSVANEKPANGAAAKPSLDFTIPPEYQHLLEPTTVRDTRSDAEILEALTQHVPVTSEKNVWAFWHAGVTEMPGWSQRNVLNWVRMCAPDGWTIRVLDNVPESPNYALKWLQADELPKTFVNRTHDGPYVGQHSADFVRGALLYRFGGVWMDVGCFLIRDLGRFCWDKLEDETSPFTVAIPLCYDQTIMNYFVAARKGDPLIKRWHELFMHLWEGQLNHEGIINNPLLAFMMEIEMDKNNAELGFAWEFAVPHTTVFEYVAQIGAWKRLCMLEPPEGSADPFNPSEYWQKHVMCIDVLHESWPADRATKFNSAKAFRLLSRRRDEDVGSEEHDEAEKLIWTMLTDASMQKISRGKKLMKSLMIGQLLDQPENTNIDIAPGTYWELLRYGSLHWRQTRPEIRTKKAERAEKPIRKGLLEP